MVQIGENNGLGGLLLLLLLEWPEWTVEGEGLGGYGVYRVDMVDRAWTEGGQGGTRLHQYLQLPPSPNTAATHPFRTYYRCYCSYLFSVRGIECASFGSSVRVLFIK